VSKIIPLVIVMAGFMSKIKRMVSGSDDSQILEDTEEQGYVELSTESQIEGKSKITVRPFVIEDFESIKPILDNLREGHTICLINIKPLKDKDLIELKRAINKIKKTCDAVEGDIAGFGENWIAAVPSFAHIYRAKPAAGKPAEGQKEHVGEVTEYNE
jgi:SepF-like predicted cell division protein (DUF552 family)